LLLLFILVLTRRTKVNMPFHRLTMGNPALTPLAALTWCFGFATIAGVIGLSPAFGAFLAGLVVGNSAQRHIVHENAVPVQAVLMMVFFLSVGLLIDLPFVWNNIWLLLGLWGFVTFFKTALNTCLLRLQGQNWQTAFHVSLVIAQLGEFSFLLAAAGLSAAVIDAEIHRMIVALTVISLMMSPIFNDLSHRLHHRAAKNIGSVGGLLRFAYVREWRVTKRISRAAWALLFRLATWTQLRVERKRGDLRARRAAGRRLNPSVDIAETDGDGAAFDVGPVRRLMGKPPKAGPGRLQARADVAAAMQSAARATAGASPAKAPQPEKDAGKNTTKQMAPKKGGAKKGASKKAAPKRAASKKGTPKKSSAKKARAKKPASKRQSGANAPDKPGGDS